MSPSATMCAILRKLPAIALPLFALSGPAYAQYSAPAIRAQVVDAESGAPLEGVNVVARWEWLDYRPTLHGSPHINNGNILRADEAVTGRDGRFEIASWVVLGKPTGQLDDHHDPKLSLFKSGYAPLELRNQKWTDYMKANPTMRRDSEWNGKVIALRKFGGSPREYAELINRFQGGYRDGLWWQVTPAADAMPKMIFALYREKQRLAEDGRQVLGANLLPGRSGQGNLLDAETGKAVWPAVISITWTMRQVGGTQTRAVVQQKRGGVEGSSESFYVSPWRTPTPVIPGWELVFDRAPLVRAYAPGYRKTADLAWKGGGAIRMRKLPPGRDAVVEELRAWRRDIDEALGAASDREEALDGQWLLITTLDNECRTLTGDLRAGICFAPDSELGRFAQKARGQQRELFETVEGSQSMRVVAVNSGRAIAAAAPAVVPLGVASPQGAFGIAGPQAGVAFAGGARAYSAAMAGPPEVRGFSIEPRKP